MTTKPRRPWLAAILSLMSGPVGQIYAGRLRRSIILWCVGAALLPAFAFAAMSLPINRAGVVFLLLCVVAFPIGIAADAFFLARRHRDAPLKAYQRWWAYLVAFAMFYSGNYLVAQLVRSFVAEAFVVPMRAMSPTIRSGERIVVDKFWRHPTRLRRNDVVVFSSAGPGSPFYVMRLAGLPGDTIEMVDDRLILNGSDVGDQHAFIDSNFPAYPEKATMTPGKPRVFQHLQCFASVVDTALDTKV